MPYGRNEKCRKMEKLSIVLRRGMCYTACNFCNLLGFMYRERKRKRLMRYRVISGLTCLFLFLTLLAPAASAAEESWETYAGETYPEEVYVEEIDPEEGNAGETYPEEVYVEELSPEAADLFDYYTNAFAEEKAEVIYFQ